MAETFEVARVDREEIEPDELDPETPLEEQKYPVVHVFGYDEGGNFRHGEIVGFEPYCYVPYEEIDGFDTDSHSKIKRFEVVDDDGQPFETVRGRRVAKCVTYLPGDVPDARDEFSNSWESDVLFPTRFIIDLNLTSGIVMPSTDEQVHVDEVSTADVNFDWRIHYMDIEVDDRNGFPEEGTEPILCITAYDSFEDEYITWLQGEGEHGDYDDQSELHPDADVNVRWFDDEAEMLVNYISYVSATHPSVITGWNVDDFDLPYLFDRCDVLTEQLDEDDAIDSIPYQAMSPMFRASNHDYFGVRIKGIAVFDLLEGFEQTQFSEMDSYRLDAVAEATVGHTKETYVGTIGSLWEDDPEMLVDYNLRDVELTVEIDRREEVIAFWREVKATVGCQLGDAPVESTAADRYILNEYHGEVVFPNQGSQEEVEDEYGGGAVFDPIDGIRENVPTLDLASLYPMSMLTLNASPETKVNPDEYDGDTFHSPNGIHFRKDEDGLTRRLIEDLLERRDAKKDERDSFDPDSQEYAVRDRQQTALKVIMNCFSDDTEVMTPDGVRNITDIEVGDEVYSINPETHELEVKPVIDTTTQQNQYGELKHIQTNHIDLKITPNHRMFVEHDGESSLEHFDDLWAGTTYQIPTQNPVDGDGVEMFSLLESVSDVQVRFKPDAQAGNAYARSLPDELYEEMRWDTSRKSYRIPVETFRSFRSELDGQIVGLQYDDYHGTIPAEYDMDDWLELVGWVVTEGSIVGYDDEWDSRGGSNRVSIQQRTDTNREQIVELVEQLGLNYTAGEEGVEIGNSILYEWCSESLGSSAETKRLPQFVFESDLTQEQYRILFETLMAGDGDVTGEDSYRYSTMSEQLSEDVMQLAVLVGYKVSCNENDDGMYRVYINKNKGSFDKTRTTETIDHDGDVHCITVEDNHTVMAGRNGTFTWSGQTLYGVMAWSRFRLYDQDVASAVTATGREVLEHTGSVVESMGYEVLYGDTDSVLLDVPDKPKDETIELCFEIEDAINESYGEFALENLNAERHWFDIEFEKLYKRYFQAGTKKRYAGHIVWKEGKDVDDVDITGFQFVRSDHSAMARETQKEVIDRIVHGSSVDDIAEYVDGVLDDWDDRHVALGDIGVPEGIGSGLHDYKADTHPVRGAKYGNMLLGTTFASGSKPKRYYLEDVNPEMFRRLEEEEGFHPGRDRMYAEFKENPWVIAADRPEELARELCFDWERMRGKNLREPLSGILGSLGLDWDEMLADSRQVGLGAFGD